MALNGFLDVQSLIEEIVRKMAFVWKLFEFSFIAILSIRFFRTAENRPKAEG
jgi:hypothetical protein